MMLRFALFCASAFSLEATKDDSVAKKALTGVNMKTGMRSEADPASSGPPESVTYKISPAERQDCVTNAIGTRTINLYVDDAGTPGAQGDQCSGLTSESDCHNAYESKSRHSHTSDAHPSPHSLKGEVQLCKWKEYLAGHQCEPESPILVCGADDSAVDVVQVTNGGVGAGNAAVTGTLPDEPAGLPSAMQPYGQTSLVQRGKEEEAQGRCGPDTHTCDDGSIIHRDPSNTCRFASCGTSLIEAGNEPTFQWTGVSISDNQNFCARMTPILGDYTDLHVETCASVTETDCTNHYMHVNGGRSGDIRHCRVGSSGCEAGAVHNCTWSFYMEDLISKHSSSEDNCAAKLLEAKRSLDGLLHSVQDVYNQLMQWNAIVQAENSTIRGLLEDQQNDWDDYVSEQQNCDSLYSSDMSNLQNIQNEMTELRAIANPDVRSAVDVRQARGYQSSGTTSESCPGDYPYVSTTDTSYCCLNTTSAAEAQPSTAGCSQRNCQDASGAAVACVNNARADDSGMLSPSQTAAAAASFAELGEEACQSFSSLVERVQKTHGKKIKLNQPANCHAQRSALEELFKNAFLALGKLYNEEIFTLESNRSICLNEATYNYKAGVEGIDGIDDQIQDAAGKIHEAQGEIARLEPMLHDVERAVNRMRTYVETITEECGTEEYIGHLYKDIQEKIVALQECPGRNDFIIDVPHWRPKRQIGGTTPAPTPWYEDPKAEDVRTVL